MGTCEVYSKIFTLDLIVREVLCLSMRSRFYSNYSLLACLCITLLHLLTQPLLPLLLKSLFLLLSRRVSCPLTYFQPSSSHRHTSVHGRHCLLMLLLYRDHYWLFWLAVTKYVTNSFPLILSCCIIIHLCVGFFCSWVHLCLAVLTAWFLHVWQVYCATLWYVHVYELNLI